MGTKDKEIEDLLGDGDNKPAKAKKTAAKPADKADKKTKAEKPAKEDKPAKAGKPAKAPKEGKAEKPAKAEKPKAKKPADAGEKPARTREPITFEEGERDKIAKKVEKQLTKVDKKKGINTKDLSAAVEVPTRKLRAVLYSMERAEQCKLKPGSSRAAGMTVCPA
jgi:hypothetical protein